jgi:hypothetical protein
MSSSQMLDQYLLVKKERLTDQKIRLLVWKCNHLKLLVVQVTMTRASININSTNLRQKKNKKSSELLSG